MNEEDWETFKNNVVRLEKRGINPYPQNKKTKSISQKTEKVIDSQESLGQMETIGNYDTFAVPKNPELKILITGRINSKTIMAVIGKRSENDRKSIDL